MALINCSECGKSISDRANACPHCGNPMLASASAAAPTPVSVTEASTVTTQATGKGPKIAQLVGFLFITAGVVSCVAGPEYLHSASGLLLLGVAIWFAGRFAAWWGHG